MSGILERMENKNYFPETLATEFTPLKHLGTGAFGSVWAVRRKSDGKTFAIKLFNRDLTDDPVCLKRFQREKELAGRRLHKGIVDIYATGEAEGSLYLVMELIAGRSLAAVLEEARPLDTVDSMQLCLELANCMAALHEAGFIHRDIKPDNIFIEPDGRPRLLDLGLARDLGGEKLTKTGVILGSPFYMSPALCMGEKATSSDDVFALGMTLLQCLSSSNPATRSDSLASLMSERVTPDWKVSIPVTCGGAVTKLIRRLTAANVQSRPSNGKEAAAAISEAMANLSSVVAFEATVKGDSNSVEDTVCGRDKRTSGVRSGPKVPAKPKLLKKRSPTKPIRKIKTVEPSSEKKPNIRFIFPLIFLFVAVVIAYQLFFGTRVKKVPRATNAPTKSLVVKPIRKGPWPGFEFLEKVAQHTESAKKARNDWELKDAAGDGLRQLKKLAKLDWSPDSYTDKELETLILIPRFFFIHIAHREVEQKNLNWIREEKRPIGNDDEVAVAILWASLLAHNDRRGIPDLMAKWYARGKGLQDLVGEAEKKTCLDYSLRILREMCTYLTFEKRQSNEGQEYLQKCLERLQRIAQDLRRLRLEGKSWANLLLLVCLYDQAAVVSLKEAQIVNDEANQQLDRIALEAETLVPKIPNEAPIPIEVKLAIYCRELAYKRPFNESAFAIGAVHSNPPNEKTLTYQQLAFSMALAHMSRYDKPIYVELVHLSVLKAPWLDLQLQKDIVDRFGKTVRKAYELGLIKELPSPLK